MDYPPSKLLNDDLNNIVFEEDTTIFICLYKIHFLNNKPYIQYLLYKQRIHTQHICSFLYIHFKNNKIFTLESVKSILDNLSFKNIDFKGYLQNNLLYYLFYQVTEDYTIDKYNENTILLWTSIYEIVQMQQILNIPIHSTVFSLFYSNKLLIYLYNTNKIPITIYSKIPFIEFISNCDNYGNIIVKHDDDSTLKNDTIRMIIFIKKEFSNKYLVDDIFDLKILSE